jgi:hypothetical protein
MSSEQIASSKKPVEWNEQQAKLLQNWAEIAGSYRWLHNQAHMQYRKKNLHYMIPLIIMSTVTGTANFAQSTFPASVRSYVPQIIGAINLIAAIMTTIYQFLKVSEYMESHRITSINYGKFARNIVVELNLPVKNRSIGGNDLVKISRNEIDRLIEQSPSIPGRVLSEYKTLFSGTGLAQPEILHINKVDVYNDEENKVSTTLADAGLKFKKALFKKPVHNTVSSSPLASVKDRLMNQFRKPEPEQNLSTWEKTIKELKSVQNVVENNIEEPVKVEEPVKIEERVEIIESDDVIINNVVEELVNDVADSSVLKLISKFNA